MDWYFSVILFIPRSCNFLLWVLDFKTDVGKDFILLLCYAVSTGT